MASVDPHMTQKPEMEIPDDHKHSLCGKMRSDANPGWNTEKQNPKLTFIYQDFHIFVIPILVHIFD